MDICRIKELIEIMKESNLKVLEINTNNESYKLMYQDQIKISMPEKTTQKLLLDTVQTITSPMPGIAYRAQSPEAKPFIECNEYAKTGDVLCVIEAMKIFHDITAKEDCEIVEICFRDGELVEYGQPLFRVKEVKVNKNVFKNSDS